MDKNFVRLLFPDFFQKISNFPDFSWSSNKKKKKKKKRKHTLWFFFMDGIQLPQG